MPQCDVCDRYSDWNNGYALTTRQVACSHAYWEYILGNLHKRKILAISDPQDRLEFAMQFVARLIGNPNGWLVCENCRSMFSFDSGTARQYARRQQNPPGSGPVHYSEVLPYIKPTLLKHGIYRL